MECCFCGGIKFVKNGFFETNRHRVQRYKCKGCGNKQSAEIEDKFDKKPELKLPIQRLIDKGISQRKVAIRLNCSRSTIQLKIRKNK